MPRAGGGNEGGPVGAFVETQAGAAECAAQTLGQTEGKPLFFIARVIEQGGESGIDGGGLRVAGHGGEIKEFEVRGGMVGVEMAFHRCEVGQFFRGLAFERVILDRLRSFGAPLLDHFRIAFHFQPGAEGFEVETGETFAMKVAELAFEVMMVRRTEQEAGHTADRDDREIAFGRFDFDGLGAVEFFPLLAQEVTQSGVAVEPHAPVDVDHIERPFRLLRRGGEVDGVGGRVAQEDAGDIEEAEGFAGVADLLGHGFDRGGGGGEGDTEPGKRIRGRGRMFVAAGTRELIAGRRSAEFLAIAVRRFSPAEATALVRTRTTGLARFAELARFERRGRRRVLGP